MFCFHIALCVHTPLVQLGCVGGAQTTVQKHRNINFSYVFTMSVTLFLNAALKYLVPVPFPHSREDISDKELLHPSLIYLMFAEK